jgi:integrase/recombinase XerC
MPYGDDEVAALLQAAHDPLDAVLVLRGAHAGLRAQECTDLRWAEVHLARRDLVVRHGKGGKQRVVALSATLRQALAALERRADGYVLPYRTAGSAWRHLQAVCRAAGVTPKGVHALRHSTGTRLYAETRDLEATARHLGHAKLETTRIYAKWSDRHLRETIGRW